MTVPPELARIRQAQLRNLSKTDSAPNILNLIEKSPRLDDTAIFSTLTNKI